MDVRDDQLAKLQGSPAFLNVKAEHDLIVAQALWSERRVQFLVGVVALVIAVLSFLASFLQSAFTVDGSTRDERPCRHQNLAEAVTFRLYGKTNPRFPVSVD